MSILVEYAKILTIVRIFYEYTLYLDESRNDEGTYFAVSGIIIKNEDIDILNAGILEAKHCIWDDEYIEKLKPVLHCVELTTIKNCCWNNRYLSSYVHSHPQYTHLQTRSASDIRSMYNGVYSKLCKLVKTINGTVIGCSIDINKFKYLYGGDFKVNSELFFEVAMQETVENYAHFLYKNNGTGSVVYESRNDENAKNDRSPDFKMYHNFCQIKSSNKGISFMNQSMMAKTIRYLNIFSKRDDVAGLQLADFIAYNTTAVKSFIKDNNKTEFQRKNSRKMI